MAKKTKIIFLIAGLLILLLLFRSFGITKLIDSLKNIGWKILLIVCIHLVGNIAYTYAWKLFVDAPVSFRQFCRMCLARVAGDSGSAINSLGAVAGEGLKAMYVKDFIPMNKAVASVILDRLMHNFSNVFIVLTGVIISLFIIDLPLYIIIACFAITAILIAISVFLLKKQSSGFIEYFTSRLLPVKIRKRLITEERLKKIRDLDEKISVVNAGNTHVVVFSVMLHYITTLCVASLEIFLIVQFSEHVSGFSLPKATFVYVFGFFWSSAAFFIPANVGVSEGSYAYAFKLLALDPALGLSLGVIRRLVAFIRAGIGILLLLHAGLFKKSRSQNK